MSSTSLPWYANAVFYELYIRAYRDSNGDGHGDLRGVIEKLDYIKSLGVDCVWLLPMYPSPLKDDGYDIADFYGIHPTYGTVEDFETLLEAAHARGLRIITDLVINHTSDEHPWFIESRSSRSSPRRDWYVWSDTPDRYREARIIFVDAEESNWAYDEGSGQYYWHRFFSSQPDLNYDNPEVQQAMIDVMAFWLEKGIDGFRVDAVPYLYEREGTNCENLPETHAYLKQMRRALDEHWPHAMMLCEANQPPADVVHYFGEGDEFHMGFHFPLMPRIFMALRSGDVTRLRRIMEETPPIPPGCQWCTFLRNHDELTLEMVSEEERQWMWQEYAPEPRMRRNLGIRRRLAPLLDNDPEKIMLANRLLFSLPGVPIIYYGDEIGMGDNIWLFDRNGVRTPMQWDDSPNAGFSETEGELYAPVIDDAVYGFRRVNVAAQLDDPGSLLNRTRALIALRKQHPVLATGSLRFLDVDTTAVLAFIREDEESVLAIAHNVSAAPQAVALDLARYAGRSVVDVLNEGQERRPVGMEPYRLALGPFQSVWLLLR
ncbi:MAG: maltose alpha-D-glucosyltransferase [Anaerolineae bacterium]